MSKITINGTELELNLLDADVLDKYTELNREITQKIQEPTQYQGITVADGLRKQCRYIEEFFDKLFGAGTAEKLFGGGNDLGIRMEAFGQVSAASRDARKELSAITDKYGVNRIQNREQRRQQERQGKHGKPKYNNRSNPGSK